MHQSIPFSLLLASMAAAKPGVFPVGTCPIPVYTYTAKAGPVFWDPPVLSKDAQTCGSTSSTTCTIGRSVSISNGFTLTVGASFGLDLVDIGSIAFTPSIAYSYTYTTGTSDGVTCPSASPFYTCGMTSTSPFQMITGTKKTCGGGNYPACKACSTVPYAIKVPAQGNNVPRWDPCIASNSANKKTQSGLVMCP